MIMINARLYYSHGLSSTKGYAHYFIIKLIMLSLALCLAIVLCLVPTILGTPKLSKTFATTPIRY